VDSPEKAAPNSTPDPETNSRPGILFFAATLAIITYIDRVCISQAAPAIQKDLRLDDWQMGLAFSAFSIAYALFEIPTGWLGDKIGPGKVLMRIVLAWSVFTGATGYCWNLLSLVFTRFCFGTGEAGCFPNLTKAFAIWLPKAAHPRAQGIMWLSARWGGAFTPLLVLWVMTCLSWRKTFLVFGGIGIAWAFLFYDWHRRPFKSSEQPRNSMAAAANVPWRNLLSSRSVKLLWLQYFCLTYGWFFYVTWMPTYLNETRGLALNQNVFMVWLGDRLGTFLSPEITSKTLIAALAAIPLFFGGFGALLSGMIAPKLVARTGNITMARRAIALAGFAGASLLVIGSTYINDPLLAMLALGAASFSNDLTMPVTWNSCMDIGGRFAGTLSGSMNMMGSIGAALAPLLIGLMLDHTHRNWNLTFWVSGIIYFCGGLCWLWIDPTTPIETQAENGG
jgi:ACS family glucarate transporter-like MFS transporter